MFPDLTKCPPILPPIVNHQTRCRGWGQGDTPGTCLYRTEWSYLLLMGKMSATMSLGAESTPGHLGLGRMKGEKKKKKKLDSHLTYFKPLNSPSRFTLFPSFCKWENGGSEGISTLPGIIELPNSGPPALQSCTQPKSKNSYSLDNGDLINSAFILKQKTCTIRRWVWTGAAFSNTKAWVIPQEKFLPLQNPLVCLDLFCQQNCGCSILSTDWAPQLSLPWWRHVKANFKSDYRQHDIYVKLFFKQAAAICLGMPVSEFVARSLCSRGFLSHPGSPLQMRPGHSIFSSKSFHERKEPAGAPLQSPEMPWCLSVGLNQIAAGDCVLNQTWGRRLWAVSRVLLPWILLY